MTSVLTQIQYTICDPGTPYDGTYHLHEVSGQYQSSDGSLFLWSEDEGRWVFWNFILRTLMVSVQDSLQTNGDWIYRTDPAKLYTNVEIRCPTSAPTPNGDTLPPSRTPSSAPITSPTKTPVRSPSSQPTNTDDGVSACIASKISQF